MVHKNAGTQHVVATFRLPAIEAQSACVVGEFNEWSHTANPMVRHDDGFEAQVALQPGRAYRFRYLLDGERWENDWQADAYVPNEFGGDDSVIDLTDTALAAPDPDADADGGAPATPRAARKKAAATKAAAPAKKAPAPRKKAAPKAK